MLSVPSPNYSDRALRLVSSVRKLTLRGSLLHPCLTIDSQAETENELKGKRKVSDQRQKEIDGTLKPEPLLTENPGRFVLFPIQDNEVRLRDSMRTMK